MAVHTLFNPFAFFSAGWGRPVPKQILAWVGAVHHTSNEHQTWWVGAVTRQREYRIYKNEERSLMRPNTTDPAGLSLQTQKKERREKREPKSNYKMLHYYSNGLCYKDKPKKGELSLWNAQHVLWQQYIKQYVSTYIYTVNNTCMTNV